MHEIQANMASKILRRQSSHLVFHKMFVDTLIRFWSMATQAGTFTVVSVTKAIWLQTVLVVNVSKLMHMSTVWQHQTSKTWRIFEIGSGAQIASRIMINHRYTWFMGHFLPILIHETSFYTIFVWWMAKVKIQLKQDCIALLSCLLMGTKIVIGIVFGLWVRLWTC